MLPLIALVAATTNPLVITDDSEVRFTAHQTFSQTDGKFADVKGAFDIDREDVSKSYVRVKIRAASIDTDNSSRDDHLRSEDFFDVKKYEHIVFESTSIAPVDADHARVKGLLRVKDKKVPVEFTMKLTWRDDGVDAYGRLTIDRNTIGITYEAPFYAPLLKANVNLELDVKLRRRAD